MYSLESLRYGLENPRKILQECNRLYYRRLRTWPYNRSGVDIFERDWDNLLILDACRYDLFERRSTLPGKLEPAYSRASATEEFLKANFDGRELLDTVYVTGSPMLHRHREEIDTRLHDVINVWRENGWSDEYRTVLPQTMTEAAIDASETYPNKRLIVHYMQPHYPFVGPTGQAHFDLDRLDFEWEALLRGELGVSDEIVERAYAENLDEALPHVERALRHLTGRSVVTADHGQVIGSRAFPIPIREYGHPQGIYTEGLVKVPWLTFQNGPRREIIAEEPTKAGPTGTDVAAARERLEELGYVN